jgi:hypothetical protein
VKDKDVPETIAIACRRNEHILLVRCTMMSYELIKSHTDLVICGKTVVNDKCLFRFFIYLTILLEHYTLQVYVVA